MSYDYALAPHRRKLQLAGDREEGELSEMDSPASSKIVRDNNRSNALQNHAGTNPSSVSSRAIPRATLSPPKGPRLAMNTNYRKPFRQNPQPTQNMSPNPSGEKVNSIPVEKIPTMRETAQQFVTAWHKNGHTFSQLLEEGFDVNFIRSLYDELGLDTTSKNATPTTATAPNLEMRNPKLPPKPPAAKVNASQSYRQPNLPSGPATIALPALPESNKGMNVNTITKSPHIPDLPDNQLKSLKPTFARPPQLSNGDSRESPINPQASVANRQDYIARLNAAKTKKSAIQPVSTTSLESEVSSSSHQLEAAPPIPASISQTMSLNRGPNMSESIGALKPVPAKPLNTQASDESSWYHNAKVEAVLTGVEKRKAQTELARLRMQALIAAKAHQISATTSPLNSSQPVPSSQPTDSPKEERQDLGQAMTEKDGSLKLESPLQPPHSPPTQPVLHSSTSESSISVYNDREIADEKMSRSVTPSSNLAPAKWISSSNIVPSRIPGLFMTSPLSLQKMEMPQADAEATTIASAQPSFDNIIPTLSRKRPVASDFDNEAVPQPYKRPFGRPRDQKDTVDMIIQVSDDESSDDETPGSNEAVTSQPSALHRPAMGSAEPAGLCLILPAYSGAPSVAVVQSTIKSGSGQESGATTPLLTLSELKAREGKILLMKKRIAEMEQKRIAKSLTSGFTTPGTPRNDLISVAIAPPTVDQKVPSNDLSKELPEDTQHVQAVVVDDSPITESRKVVKSNPLCVDVDHQKTFDVSPAPPAFQPADLAANLGRGINELENPRESKSPLRNSDLVQKQIRLEMLKQQVRELQEAIERAAVEGQTDAESQHVAAHATKMLHNEAQTANQDFVDNNKDIETGCGSHTQLSQAPDTFSSFAEELPSSTVAVASMEELLPSHGANYTPNEAIDDHYKERPPDDDADDADDSMSLDDSSDEDEAPSPMQQPPDGPHANIDALPDSRDQCHDSKSYGVDMPDITSKASDDGASSSPYYPEIKSPSSSSHESASVAPITDDSSIESSKLETPDVNTHVKPVHDGSLHPLQGIDHGIDDNDHESLDEDEYEPPDADLAPTISQNVNGFSSSYHDSDSDYEPPDAVSSVQPSDTNLQIIPPVNANDKQQILNPESQPTNITQELKYETFTQYESPLAMFKSFRFHPGFTDGVTGGIRSLTYSHNIDQEKQLCAYESAGGVCNDPQCGAQHFRTMAIGDNEILKQIGTSNPGRTEAERQEYVQGLRSVVNELRQKNIKDAAAVASEIFAYRRRFLKDPTKVLSL